MKRTIRKMGLGLLVGATVVLGGGFASADYNDGDETSESSFEISYTVSSFRALELSDTSRVPFGTIRQGEEAKSRPGPTLLYGTTWPGDEIIGYLDSAMINGVKLGIDVGVATPPDDFDVTCEGAGTSAPDTVDLSLSYVDMSSATPTLSEPLITGINNCGAPGYSSGPPYTGLTQSDVDATSDRWATASTLIWVDASGAAQAGEAASLYTEVVMGINFRIQDMPG